MVRAVVLLGVIASLIFGVSGQSATSDACSSATRLAGLCQVDASTDADQVNLIGSVTTPGNTTPGPQARNLKRPDRDGVLSGIDEGCAVLRFNRCYATVAKRGAPATAAAVGVSTPSVTLRDLAAFRPTPGTEQMEPNGWVVPGLDANIYAIVGQQLVPGTLLGQPATVRFTPVRFHWTYGDGSSAIRSTPGATWTQLGLRDFDPTPTSHVYAREGAYTIRLTIDFRAEYRFGSGGFRAISGTINLPANDLHITVTGAKTVLVDHDCVANPAGPGC